MRCSSPPPPASPNVALASAGDNIADGYRAVAAHLAARPGAPVLVVGGQASSIGLYAVACARCLGSTDVRYLDHNRERLGIAARFGARPIEGRYPPVYGPFPITVDASADVTGLAAALQSTEPGGVCTSVGIYYEARTPMPLRSAYGIGLTFITGRAHSRALLPEVLDLLASQRLDVTPATTRVARWEDAVEALLEPSTKVVVTRG